MKRHAALLTMASLMASFPADARQVAIKAGQEVPLATVRPLSSAKQVMGELVDFVTAADVVIDGTVVVPMGTPVVGQVTDARDRGAAGMSGKLVIRPLYMRIGKAIVRLRGGNTRQVGMSEGEVASFVLNPLFFTGHTVRIPAGSPFIAVVEKEVAVTVSE
ncbi:MAG: hypothetical protein J0I47_08770 [Sphingomonas sp.]|uniref:hypothetical protein n=1 Tax=Sphingomonas sp. TaxID=28214 RepID=UPI001AD44641|nr:hypothetical protein [Sphingomonas sp.]MBN8808313.1 hypothetical protein [Sphingomonas sp.]